MAFILIAPSLCLSYILTSNNGHTYQIPFGQYIFFFGSTVSTLIILLSKQRSYLCNIFRDKYILLSIFLVVTGLMFSEMSFWNWRLTLLVFSISSFAVVGAFCVMEMQHHKQNLALFFLVLPFAFPTLFSVFLEFFGPLDIGAVITNTKHLNFSHQRWMFLSSSANGFGFNASVSLVVFICMSQLYINRWAKFFCVLAAVISAYALFKSGTRACYLLSLFAIFNFIYWRFGSKFFINIVFVSSLVGVVITLVNVDLLVSLLRIDASLDKFSSHRSVALLQMWELFVENPLRGLGFGAADKNFPVNPSNMFYFSLPLEIGLLGSIGVFLICWKPVLVFFKRNIVFRKIKSSDLTFNGIEVVALSLLVGFLPYLFFEFNILRVSAANQLFFFCWGVVLLTEENQNRKQL